MTAIVDVDAKLRLGISVIGSAILKFQWRQFLLLSVIWRFAAQSPRWPFVVEGFDQDRASPVVFETLVVDR